MSTNTIFPLGREKWGNGQINWIGDDIRLVIVDATYVYNENHEFHTDLTGILATSGNLTGKTNVGGVLDAADVTLPAVANGNTVKGIVFYKWTGVAATSPLLLNFGRNAASVIISAPTDGGDMFLGWSNGPNKIVKL